MALKALFLDRDGVVNVDKHYVYRIEDFEFVPGIFDVLRDFQIAGYSLIIVTNQSGIGRGLYTEDDFERLTAWMLRRFLAHGVTVSKVYYSPYHPEEAVGRYRRHAWCRKPNPGMLLQAQRELGIAMRESIMVGDKPTDIEAGIRAGIATNIMVAAPDARVACGDGIVIPSIEGLRAYLPQNRS